MSEPARAAKPVTDALAEGRRRTGGSRHHVAPAGLASKGDPGVARSGVKMGWWSPCDAVALWILQAVI